MVFSEYAKGVDGTGKASFTTAPTDKTKYMGVANAMTAPTNAAEYTWTQYKEMTASYDNSGGKPTIRFHN